MTVNLDVFMYLARIALTIAGVIAVVYLVLLFKSLIDTLKTFQKTLDAVNRDLVKLESPLDTIGSVSNTVDEVQASAKKAAMGAIKVFSDGTAKVGSMMNRKKDAPKATPEQSETSAADFQPIMKSEIIETETIQSVPADSKAAPDATVEK